MDSFCDILFATENALTGSKAKIYFSLYYLFPSTSIYDNILISFSIFLLCLSTRFLMNCNIKNILLGQPNKDSTEIHLHSLGTEIFLK